MSPDSMGLPWITSTCCSSYHSCNDIWWLRTQSWSINAMPVAAQSIRACVGICSLFVVNMQVITKCFPSIDCFNTSTLLTERRNIPEHFKAFKAKLFCQSKTDLSMTDLIFFRFLRTRPCSYFLNFCPSCLKPLCLFACRTICCPVVKSTIVQPRSIHKPFRPFFHWNPPCTLAEVSGNWSTIYRNCSGRGSCGIFRRCTGFWWGGEINPSCCPRCGLRSLLLWGMDIPFLVEVYNCGKFLRHIGILEGILHLLQWSRSQCILMGWGITIQVCSDKLELSIILSDFTFQLFNFVDFSLCCGHSVRVPKSCIQELYWSW